MIALKVLAVAVFIITGGAVFSDRFRKYRLVAAAAALVSLMAAYFLIQDLVNLGAASSGPARGSISANDETEVEDTTAQREAARMLEEAAARRRQEEEGHWERCCNNSNVTIAALDEYLGRVQRGDFPGRYTGQAGQIRDRLEANMRPVADLDPDLASMSDSQRLRAIEAQSRLETLRVAVGPACQLFGGTEETYYGTTFYIAGNCRNQNMRSPDDTGPGCRVTSGSFHALPRWLRVQDCVINGRFMASCAIDWNGECGRG